ncbi:hypothetical protein [Parapedobacter tibetensis]|uniref:hypothetical protein n=1 Tax=Parapedobacter tibetensis TaxID=2972951 RepID=UPI00214D7F81|nr:hypothetical protein [Parapedobacter tibetensis]
MKINHFLFGCIIGLLAPTAAHLLTLFTSWNMVIGNKSLSLYVIAALINLLLMRFFYRNALEQSARGVILITFVAAMVLLFTQKLTA